MTQQILTPESSPSKYFNHLKYFNALENSRLPRLPNFRRWLARLRKRENMLASERARDGYETALRAKVAAWQTALDAYLAKIG